MARARFAGIGGAPRRQDRPRHARGGQPKKQSKPQILDQWIDIEVVDGETVVSYYPPNEELLEKGKRMAPPPTMVYRRFHFVDHVPPEYAWRAIRKR